MMILGEAVPYGSISKGSAIQSVLPLLSLVVFLGLIVFGIYICYLLVKFLRKGIVYFTIQNERHQKDKEE